MLGLVVASCGGNDGVPSPTNPSISCSNLPNATTILIASNAVCPQMLTVPRGARVTFMNNDNRAHEMYSDPHPEHTDCPELNQVGHLAPGQLRESGNLTAAGRCGFHDHLNAGIAALRGTIIVQ
jgi:hypothetical protein